MFTQMQLDLSVSGGGGNCAHSCACAHAYTLGTAALEDSPKADTNLGKRAGFVINIQGQKHLVTPLSSEELLHLVAALEDNRGATNTDMACFTSANQAYLRQTPVHSAQSRTNKLCCCFRIWSGGGATNTDMSGFTSR